MPKPKNLYLRRRDFQLPVPRTCLILFLTLIFSLQQFAAYAQIHAGNLLNDSQTSGFHAHHHLFSAHYSHSLPFNENNTNTDAELSEEEEIKNNFSKYWTASLENQNSNEFCVTNCLNSRFLQIISSIHKQPCIPLFILYQNRKSFLI